jgi:hypothetical protein
MRGILPHVFYRVNIRYKISPSRLHPDYSPFPIILLSKTRNNTLIQYPRKKKDVKPPPKFLIMASSTRPATLSVSLDDLAKMIDHSLLHPTMTDDDVLAGLQISKKYGVATGKSASYPQIPPPPFIHLPPLNTTSLPNPTNQSIPSTPRDNDNNKNNNNNPIPPTFLPQQHA